MANPVAPKIIMLCSKHLITVELNYPCVFILSVQEAYVENLNGPYLFDTMFEEDPDASKLAALPGVDELLAVYPLYNRTLSLFSPFRGFFITDACC